MHTEQFRTKTLFIERKNTASDKVWGIAVDIGYSGTKIMAPNLIACFPSFAIQVTGSMLNLSTDDPTMILYRDCANGKIWKVGKCAQDTISPQDPDTASMAIYGRQRYFDPMFTVIARTALGIATRENKFGSPKGKKIYLETGLPNSYIRSDTPLVKEVLATPGSFDLRIGCGSWEHFDIAIPESNIFVMPQPMGTLLSVSTKNDGTSVAEAADFYKSSVLICDPGFGTMDCFSLKGSEMNGVETFDSLGMKQVLVETSNALFEQYHVEIPVPAMQKYLESGYITQFDRATRSGKNIDFANTLEQCNKLVADRAIDKIAELYNNLLEYRYMILTGGTGEAWYQYFTDAFKGIPNLTIIPGNMNTDGMMNQTDPLPFIFSNVRGYYLYLQHKFQ